MTALRSALVALDGAAYSESAAALSLQWAKRSGARLLGLGVRDAPSIDRPEPVPMGAGAYKRTRDEARLVDAHRRVLGFLADFKSRSAAAGVTADVVEDIGEPAVRILREVQRCDLVGTGRQTHFCFQTHDQADTPRA